MGAAGALKSALSQKIPLVLSVLVALPVVSKTDTLTLVPRQTGMRCAVVLRRPGFTMFPVMAWETLELFSAFWPLPRV